MATEKPDVVIVGAGAAGGILATELPGYGSGGAACWRSGFGIVIE